MSRFVCRAHYGHTWTDKGTPPHSLGHQPLEAALQAFSDHGYDAMSVRLLNRDLGLSHGTVSQRFGPKHKLFEATVDWALKELRDDPAFEQHATFADDLDQLNDMFYRFLLVSNHRPQIVRLIQHEATRKSSRLGYIAERFTVSILDDMASCIDRLIAAGRVRPVDTRAILLMLVFGATAPITMPSLANHYGSQLVDSDELAKTMADVLVSGVQHR